VGKDGRDDTAGALKWASRDARYSAGLQRVAVRDPGFSDTTTSVSLSAGNGKHFSVFGTAALEAGTAIQDATEGKYSTLGVSLYAPNKSIYVGRADYGREFSPADAYVTLLDAHGYSASAYQQFNGPEHLHIKSTSFSYYADRYTNRAGYVTQTDSDMFAAILTNNQTRISLNFNMSRGLDSKHGMVPYDQSGIFVYLGANTSRNGGLGYYAGRFFDGFLRNAHMFVTLKMHSKVTVNFSESRYVYTSRAVGREVQQADIASYAYQSSKDGSFALGVRSISGSRAYFLPTRPIRATNIAASLNQRLEGWHVYFVYGDPNALSTVPSIVLKVVRYIGADEGT